MKRFIIITLVFGALTFGCAGSQEARMRKALDKYEKEKAEKFRQMSPAEHIAEARSLCQPNANNSSSCSDAEKHLQAIPSNAPEYGEAQKLLEMVRAESKRLSDQYWIDQKPLEIVKKEWSKGGFDTVSIWLVTFRNRGSKPVGDITYRTQYFSETGNLVGKGGVDSPLGDKTIQKVIPPGEERTIEVNDGFVHGEAEKAKFELVSWRFIENPR